MLCYILAFVFVLPMQSINPIINQDFNKESNHKGQKPIVNMCEYYDGLYSYEFDGTPGELDMKMECFREKYDICRKRQFEGELNLFILVINFLKLRTREFDEIQLKMPLNSLTSEAHKYYLQQRVYNKNNFYCYAMTKRLLDTEAKINAFEANALTVLSEDYDDKWLIFNDFKDIKRGENLMVLENRMIKQLNKLFTEFLSLYALEVSKGGDEMVIRMIEKFIKNMLEHFKVTVNQFNSNLPIPTSSNAKTTSKQSDWNRKIME